MGAKDPLSSRRRFIQRFLRFYEFALVHSKWYSAYRKPLRHAYARPSSPFRGGFHFFFAVTQRQSSWAWVEVI